MQRAAFDEEQSAVDAHDLTTREAVTDDAHGDAVGILAVERHEDTVVHDEEVRVARRQIAPGEANGLGQRELEDVEALSARTHLAQALKVLLHRRVIRRRFVRLADSEDRARRDEPGEVVDVPVGIVVGQAFADPEQFVDREAGADGGVERGVVAAFGAVRIVLHGLGGEEQAVAGDFDAAAFELERIAELLHAELGGDLAGDLVVERGLELAAPAVELPVGEREFLRPVVLHEDRAVVAAPDVVGGDVSQFDDGEVGLGGLELAFGFGAQLAGGVDLHRLEAADRGGELRELRGDEVVVTGPERGVRRPREPRGGLGFPFRGHAETEGAWRGHAEGQSRRRRVRSP